MTLSRFGLAISLVPLALQGQTSSAPCTGLCQQQVQCPSGGTTSISGTVYAPNGTDPIPNVTVYIPNAVVGAFPAGVSCPVPGALPSGSPLVGTFTAPDGTFSIGNVPVGTNIPLVIVAGKWRRQITIPQTTACTNTVVNGARFPTNQTEGDIPKFAVLTGNADQVECVLRKVGIADSEFTDGGGSGRIQVFAAANAPGATIDAGTTSAATLLGSQTTLNGYDVLMLPCEGNAFNEPAAQLSNLVTYANAGGRVYASHYAYEWMYHNPPFDTVANWRGASSSLANGPATVNPNFGSGVTLTRWLSLVGASSTPGQIDLQTTRNDLNGVNPPTQVWLTLNSTNNVMQFTFATPVGQTNNQCGRVLFNEYHVENTGTSRGKTFPTECDTATSMTPQEKLLEYSLFDLSNNGGPATIAPASADFGNQAVGFASAAKTFSITNNSVFNSSLTTASTTGDFSVAGNTCNSVPAGSTCTLSVVFTPTALGARTGALSATFAGTSLAATLTGTGVQAFGTSVTSLNFGNLDVGASATQAIQITNQAPGPLPFPSLAVSGDYHTSTDCPTTLPAGATCNLYVTFTPTASGTRSGSIAPAVGASITLTGNGVDFSVAFQHNSDSVFAGLSDPNVINLAGIAGFSAPVTLTCTSTVPVSSCSLTGASTLALSAPVSVQSSVSTASQYTLVGYGHTSLWTALAAALSVAGLLRLRRKYPELARLGILCVGLWCTASLLSGCSGKIPNQNSVYTPPGAYTVTLTASDGFLTHSSTYQLTVKQH
ncbi:choice-of-anchor D domain-containing protein [Terriglobus aquaticus]|uniref:Choice-of-anchor D domain-containing protein n=1 Tax=Terriglobus aquaticus TaxID=940139 RepID=A0ABW9KJ67_9BACT|nr:choice-of-anchor D domain-containing protein [Terriglobus aquaticus]